MKPMIWNWSDLVSIRTTILGYLTLLVATILITIYGRNTLISLYDEYEDQLERQQTLITAEEGLEKLLEVQSLPAYHRLQRTKNLKIPPRLSWIAYFDQLRQTFPVNNLQFTLSPQEAVPTPLSRSPMRLGYFYQTTVTVRGEFRHETELFKLLNDLSSMPAGATAVDHCDLHRPMMSQKEMNNLQQAKLMATCEFRLVYLLSTPPTFK